MLLPALAIAVVLTKGCHETSDSEAVGLAHCHRFGGVWSVSSGPRFDLTLELGAGVDSFVPDAGPSDLCFSVGKSCRVVQTLGPGALGGVRVTTPAIAARITLFRYEMLHAGLGLNLGQGFGPARPDGALSNAQAVIVGPMVGVDVRWHSVALLADVVPGFSQISTDAPNGLTFERGGRFALLTTAGLRFWVTPALAIQASGSIDLIEPQHLGATVSIHIPVFTAFDGQDSIFG